MSRPVITLLTDFGQADGYVGTMKGVILRICPQAALVDISHEIVPQAVQQAAYVLSTAVPYFPQGTVHLIVVDPGVGTSRRPVIVRTDDATYVAPDNGVLTLVLAQSPAQFAFLLTEPRYSLSPVSATFHGRDTFAPAAAHLATGVNPREMGEPFPPTDLLMLPLPQLARQGDGSWIGEVLYIDRFGNLVTNILCSQDGAQCTVARSEAPVPSAEISVTVAGIQIMGLSRTFAEAHPQELLAYVGSSNRLEIAVREGNAATRLGVGVGEPVHITGKAHPTRPALSVNHNSGETKGLKAGRQSRP
jgi:S-adenosylmethionine hydrolase